MNDTPRLHHNGFNGLLRNHGCGHEGMFNREMAFWQSRATTAGQASLSFRIVEIPKLAAQIRAAYAGAQQCPTSP